MNTLLKTKVGSIFCDEIDIENNSIPCTCGAIDRPMFVASTRDKVNLKKDSVLYWCGACGLAGILNNTERKNAIIYPTPRPSPIISPPIGREISFSTSR